MNKLIITALVFVLGLFSSVAAQDSHWREIKGKPLIKFDWNCASSSAYPKRRLGRLVEVAQKGEKYVEGPADRAFAFDLNGDGKLEYFVPLVCGATGNCTWGIFALRPARFLGTVNGQYIYIHKGPGRWPSIVTYGHLSAMEGVLDTYLFRAGRYDLSKKGYPIGPEDRTLEIQNVPGHRMPGFLGKARAACKDLGR
jgi:hypothetical protein